VQFVLSLGREYRTLIGVPGVGKVQRAVATTACNYERGLARPLPLRLQRPYHSVSFCTLTSSFGGTDYRRANVVAERSSTTDT